jgi:hypothetical protein
VELMGVFAAEMPEDPRQSGTLEGHPIRHFVVSGHLRPRQFKVRTPLKPPPLLGFNDPPLFRSHQIVS